MRSSLAVLAVALVGPWLTTCPASEDGPSAAPSINVSELTIHNEIECFKIQTATATYLYGKRGAGFASIVDKDGRDWVSYRPGGKAKGEYRGLPKCGQPTKFFHCGYGFGQYPTDNPFTSRVTVRERAHARIESETRDGRSACAWDFYPDHATMTLLRIGQPTYWFLYEGTPGGKLDAAKDFVIRPDGTKTTLDQPWSQVVPWVCFGAAETAGGLVLVTHQRPEPAEVDSYVSWPFQKDADGSYQDMTVFGFGRKGHKDLVEHVPDLKRLPARFSIALIDRAEAAPAKALAEKLLAAGERRATSADPREDFSLWGIASGAEWMGDYPRFNPLLHDAGVRWLRMFPEWRSIEPRKGEWNWAVADAMVASARKNDIKLVGLWAYLAPWASADGGTRKFPIKDITYWRDYTGRTVDRYQRDIKYWEVWNEFNGSFGDSQHKVKDYAELVITAHDAAKKVDPTAKIGLSVANFDVGFLDAVIKAGAGHHFDFICVHPYENLGAVAEGGEVGYLSLANNLRQMLAANKERADIPLWITEVGAVAPIKPDSSRDAHQADMLVKGCLLSMVQGFERIFWFEARGPSYGGGTDFGIIRADWSPRPAYRAMQTMTLMLGRHPRYLGWLDLGKGGYGFVFAGQEGDVLAAWSPASGRHEVSFRTEVSVTDLAGKQSPLAAGRELVLSRRPIFITKLPADLVRHAASNAGKPFPWGGDFAHVAVVSCRLGAANIENGLKQVNPNTTVVVHDLVESCRRTDFSNPSLNGEGRYAYFRVDPQFVPYGTTTLAVTIVARRVARGKAAGMGLSYESAGGYTGPRDYWTIPADERWHENTWKIHDANFVGQWGWNFRFDAVSSPNEFLIKEVRVQKSTSRPPTEPLTPKE